MWLQGSVRSRTGMVRAIRSRRSLFSSNNHGSPQSGQQGFLRQGAGPMDAPHPTTQTFLATQRKITFPPTGSVPYRLYAALVLTMASIDLYAFYAQREAVDDTARQARAGVAMLAPRAAAENLVRLDELASGATAAGANNDFPNYFPRIFRAGGLDAIRAGLESNDHMVVYAASQLANTASARPKACRKMMEDDALRAAIVKAFKHSAEAKGCEDCGQPSADNLVQLLDVLRACIRYYPFGKDASLDESLRLSLERIAARTVHFAMKNETGAGEDMPGPLILEPPVIPPFFDGTRRNPMAPGHDPFWYISVAEMLLKMSTEAAFHAKQGADKVLPVIVEPILLSLVQLNDLDVFEEQSAISFVVMCAEVLPQSKGFDPALAKVAEVVASSRLLQHSIPRRSTMKVLENLDHVLELVFAGTFGYIWGVFRTLVALRHAQPPAPVPVEYDAALGGRPSFVQSGQFRPPNPQGYNIPPYGPQPLQSNSLTEPRAWRWMMSRKYGGRAALGAVALTSWHHLMTGPFAWPVWIENDYLQAAFEVSKILSSLAITAALFQHTPYFFFPAMAAHMLDNAEVQDESVQISLGAWPRGPRFPGGSGRDSSGGRWT